MLRLPGYGSAKRVDSTMARAIAILDTREDDTASQSELTPSAEPQEDPSRARESGGLAVSGRGFPFYNRKPAGIIPVLEEWSSSSPPKGNGAA